MTTLSAIFSPFNIGPLALKNRLVSLPVYSGYAHSDGRVSSMLIEHYRQLADSGVALVTVANAAVSSDGVVAKHNLRVDRDEFIPGLARLADAIKQEDALACLQLNHGGRFAATEQPLLPSPIDGSNLAFNVASLKNFMTFFPLEKRFRLTRNFLNQTGKWRRHMTAADIGRIIVEFGAAASRAYRAGFDLIEIHGASGYLICQFLSAFTNRDDGEGVRDVRQRAAIPLAVIREIKRQVPADFPIGFRLLLREWVPDGIDLPEAIQIAELLQQEGVSYLSASVGTYNSIFSSEALQHMGRAAYLRSDVKQLSRATEIPIIISGRIILPRIAEEVIRDGVAGLVGLGRPLRADIKWIEKARRGSESIRLCNNCNGCLKQVIMERGFACIRWPAMQRERTALAHRFLSRSAESLWVITGPEDQTLFRAGIPNLLPEGQTLSASLSATVCFIERGFQQKISEDVRREFMAWCDTCLNYITCQSKSISEIPQDESGGFNRIIRTEMEKASYGMVFMAREPHQAWQKRILFRERGKIIVLLGRNIHYRQVLVPVDLSETTLLVLAMLQRIYSNTRGMQFRFMHVLRGPSTTAEKRWQELMRTAGYAAAFPLQTLQATDAVHTEILKVINTGNFGMVVMGKRGVSGIKRWMLGSVSTGVLKGLNDQTLVLMD